MTALLIVGGIVAYVLFCAAALAFFHGAEILRRDDESFRVGDAEHAPKPLGYAVFLDSLWWPGPGHMFATAHEARQAFAIGTVVALVPVDGVVDALGLA